MQKFINFLIKRKINELSFDSKIKVLDKNINFINLLKDG